MQVALATQPGSIQQLVRRSIQLYVKGLPRVFLLALVLSVIVFIPRLYAVCVGDELDVHYLTQGAARFWLILIEFSALFVFTAMLWRFRCILHQEQESIFSDMEIAVKKLPLIIAAALIQSVLFTFLFVVAWGIGFYLTQQQMITAGAMLFNGTFFATFFLALSVWVVIYLYNLLIFYLPLILTEDKGIMASLKQSVALVLGNWWRTFLFLLIPWAGYLVLLIVMRKLFNANLPIYFMGTLNHLTGLTTMLHIFLFAIFVPWFAAALLIQLRDLELRKKVG